MERQFIIRQGHGDRWTVIDINCNAPAIFAAEVLVGLSHLQARSLCEIMSEIYGPAGRILREDEPPNLGAVIVPQQRQMRTRH
jgi:hypothetical protein